MTTIGLILVFSAFAILYGGFAWTMIRAAWREGDRFALFIFCVVTALTVGLILVRLGEGSQ